MNENDFVVEVHATSPLLESPADPGAPAPGETASASAPDEPTTDVPASDMEEAPDEDGEDDLPPRKPSNLDKRFRRLTGRIRDREAQIARLEAQVDTLLRTREAPAPVPDAAQPAAEEALRPEQFPTYEAYIEALVSQRAATVVATHLQQQEAAQRAAHQQESVMAQEQAYQARVAAAKARHPDYDDVLEEATYPVSQQLLEELRASDEGPEVAYYLAQHPEEGQRLSALPPRQLARELGRLEAQLGTPASAPPAPRPAPAASQRPRPLVPVTGASAVSPFDPATASLEEYRAWRAKGGGR